MDKDIPLFFDFSHSEFEQIVSTWGEPSYRASQIWQGVYKNLWEDFEEFSSLPFILRKKLSEKIRLSSLTPAQTLFSCDRETIKTLFTMQDGHSIETVLMNYSDRRTICISSQAGCAMGCVFCATGQMGFRRNLTSGEIVEQVIHFARGLKKSQDHLTNIVIMGMGEPFLNYDAVIKAVDCLNDPDGFGFGERRFTISSVGIIPAIQRFSIEKRQVNLAISLHAANDELRSRLLPVNKKYPLTDLISACKDYINHTGRRLTFEWALIQGTNDTPDHASELAHLIKGMICHVNVIPLNPTGYYYGQPSTRQRAEIFQTVLENAGLPCTIRLRRGVDIHAGCGQLASKV